MSATLGTHWPTDAYTTGVHVWSSSTGIIGIAPDRRNERFRRNVSATLGTATGVHWRARRRRPLRRRVGIRSATELVRRAGMRRTQPGDSAHCSPWSTELISSSRSGAGRRSGAGSVLSGECTRRYPILLTLWRRGSHGDRLNLGIPRRRSTHSRSTHGRGILGIPRRRSTHGWSTDGKARSTHGRGILGIPKLGLVYDSVLTRTLCLRDIRHFLPRFKQLTRWNQLVPYVLDVLRLA